MPQILSVGWLYLFIAVMIISVVRIFFKLRTIQNEAPMDRPVIKIEPMPARNKEQGDLSEGDPLLAASDDLVRQGRYSEALRSLEQMVENLSPTENRETMGKVLFRIGACHSRLATRGDKIQHLLKAGEALREAVRLFAPARYRVHYLRALGELAGLYEDLARQKNPVEYLTQSARTCETGAEAASQGGLDLPQAMFLARSGSAYRKLATYGEAQQNLRKAADAFKKAAAALEDVEEEAALRERINILKVLGDTCVELAAYFQRADSLAWAVRSYESVLALMGEGQYPRERGVVLTEAGRILLEIYDSEKSPAHLRQALRYLRDALQAAGGEEDPIRKGMAMAVMGDALSRYADQKDRRENLHRAVKLYESALGIFKDGVQAEERERVRAALAETVQKIAGVGEGESGREGEGT
ncbi:MAG: hypothetical protein JSV70_00705 [bacterium]|nr:MAG: hypothetical protein JSV70_00705 [bacterium]